MRVQTLLLVASLAGCGSPSEEACEGDACACLVRAEDGTCCDGFLAPGPDGNCLARAWPPTQRHALGEGWADDVEVTVDGLGQAVVSWRERDLDAAAARPMLAEQRDGTWSVQALGDPARGPGTRVTLASRGLEVWSSWSQQHDTETGQTESTVFLRRRDPRGQWVDPPTGLPLSFAPKAYEPRPLLPKTGEGLVVWNQWQPRSGYGVQLARQAPGSDALVRPDSADEALSPPVFFSNGPQIAVGGNGDGVVTWYQATPAPGDTSDNPPSAGLRIFVSERSRTDGTFSPPEVTDWISPEGPPVASHETRNPVVAIDDFGAALVFWSQAHPSGATGLYMAARNGKREWTLPEDIDDTFGPLRAFATCIEVAFTPKRHAHVTWYDGVPGATTVYASHRDTDEVWTTQELSTPGVAALDPRLAVGPTGEAAVVWSERARDGRWRVMGRRRGPRALQWGDAVELSDPAGGDAEGPAVAIGPDGTLVAAWTVGTFGEQTVAVAVLP